MRKVLGPIVNRRPSYEVAVSASALSDLIMAVHAVADRSGGLSGRRWRFGNVVGIGAPQVRDLTLAAAGAKHAIERKTVAAITVAAHRRIAVDVVFTLDDRTATAQFHCATGGAESESPETAWAEYLATTTCEALAATDITPTLSR
ncbi:hypothetical protein [Nocardia bovistercoris]|uniref:Uncharacterized protein n=1 Tax=Nocardia bovistercoris TaxID=2785916 RepID=A0A931N5C8_9NOCA|nr:hypothetical protein [Nocardia bovistercoris]MBH0779602.1 hypothetical protein [Nocardia bovistercoris]